MLARSLQLLLIACLLICLTLSNSTPSLAQCACQQKPDVRTAINEASVAFVGQVEKVGKSPLKPSESEVRLQVQKKFKGFEEVQMNSIVVYTPSLAADCGFSFRAGLDYIVYATGVPAHLRVDRCSRTDLLDNVLEEVQQINAALRSPNEPAPSPEPESAPVVLERKSKSPIITAPSRPTK